MLETLSGPITSSILLASSSLFGHGHWLCEHSYSYEDEVREVFQAEVLYDEDLSFRSRGTISYFDGESTKPFARYSMESSGMAILNGSNFYTDGQTSFVKEELNIGDRMPSDYAEKTLTLLNKEIPKEEKWLTVVESSPNEMTVLHQDSGTITECTAMGLAPDSFQD